MLKTVVINNFSVNRLRFVKSSNYLFVHADTGQLKWSNCKSAIQIGNEFWIKFPVHIKSVHLFYLFLSLDLFRFVFLNQIVSGFHSIRVFFYHFVVKLKANTNQFEIIRMVNELSDSNIRCFFFILSLTWLNLEPQFLPLLTLSLRLCMRIYSVS